MSEQRNVEKVADAVWQFALDFARTSGDSLECECASCCAVRAVTCPGCGDPITTRYRKTGVCRDCYGTTDDPSRIPPQARPRRTDERPVDL